MSRREYATCKGCGADIEWAALNGRPHPFDVDPTPGPKGYELVDLPGEDRTIACYVSERIRQGRLLAGESPRLVTSHFSTCPKAAAFRKPREGGPPPGEVR